MIPPHKSIILRRRKTNQPSEFYGIQLSFVIMVRNHMSQQTNRAGGRCQATLIYPCVACEVLQKLASVLAELAPSNVNAHDDVVYKVSCHGNVSVHGLFFPLHHGIFQE